MMPAAAACLAHVMEGRVPGPHQVRLDSADTPGAMNKYGAAPNPLWGGREHREMLPWSDTAPRAMSPGPPTRQPAGERLYDASLPGRPLQRGSSALDTTGAGCYDTASVPARPAASLGGAHESRCGCGTREHTIPGAISTGAEIWRIDISAEPWTGRETLRRLGRCGCGRRSAHRARSLLDLEGERPSTASIQWCAARPARVQAPDCWP